MKHFLTLLFLCIFLVCAGCAKVYLVDEKDAKQAIDDAEKSLQTAEDTKVDLPKLINKADDELTQAKRYYNRDRFSEALELAREADKNSKNAVSLPNEAQSAIEECDKKMNLAIEGGVDGFFPEEFKIASNNLKEARERADRKNYEDAKNLSVQASAVIQKAMDEVEKTNNAVAAAKTALVNAKEAKADQLVPDQYNDARDTLSEAQAAMEERQVTKAQQLSDLARTKAEKAVNSAKEKASIKK